MFAKQVRVPFNSIVLGLDALAGSHHLSDDSKDSIVMMQAASEVLILVKTCSVD
jgi:hypothetical protein